MSDTTTTVQLKVSTKKRLEQLKIAPQESMDSVINRLATLAIDEGPLSKEDIKGIRQGLEDIEKGKVYTTAQLKKKLGI